MFPLDLFVELAEISDPTNTAILLGCDEHRLSQLTIILRHEDAELDKMIQLFFESVVLALGSISMQMCKPIHVGVFTQGAVKHLFM